MEDGLSSINMKSSPTTLKIGYIEKWLIFLELVYREETTFREEVQEYCFTNRVVSEGF